MTLTPKQQWVLDYLRKHAGTFVSPTEIGKAYKRANNEDQSWYDSSYYSGFASPICKALVEKGLATRSPKGQYAADLATGAEPFASVTKAKEQTKTESSELTSDSRTADDARLAYNAANGYVRVAVLPDGNEVYKKKNADGRTWSYYTLRGNVYNTVWNEMFGSKEEFLAIARDLYQMGYEVIVTAVEATGFKYTIGQVIWYMKDNLIHSAKVLSRDNDNGVSYTTLHGTFAEHRVYPTKDALVNSL